MSAIVCQTIDQFLQVLNERSLSTVIMAVVDEYGPRPPDEQQQANYSDEPMITLLGYDQGELVRCEILDMTEADVRARCEAAGQEVHRRSRNERTWREG